MVIQALLRGYKCRYLGVLAAATLLVSFTIPSFAQLPSGTILGVVKDPSGAVVAGATVTVRNLDTNQTRTSPTETDGSYRFPALPTGNYEIQASHEGFQTVKQAGINLTVGQEAVENITLQVGSTTQTVEVTTEAPLINTTSGTLGGLVNEQKVADLPLNGRNYVTLSLMQMGVTQQTTTTTTAGNAGTWYSSNGAPVRSNSYLLDGAQMVNLIGVAATSIANTSLGIDGIKEFKIVTNASTAEYGITMGSAMTIVTKSGTNQFHGDAFEFLRNNAMDAANFFDPTPVTFGKRIAPLRRNQFGGSLGGPIRKDKTFFFLTYEGLRQLQGVPLIQNDFSASCFNPNTKQLFPGTQGNVLGISGNAAQPCAAGSKQTGSAPANTVAAVAQPFLQLFPYPNLPSTTAGQPNNRFGYVFASPINENYAQARVDHNFSSADSVFARYTIDDTQTNQSPSYWPQDEGIWHSRPQYITLSESHIFSPALLNDARFSFSRTPWVTLSLSPGFPLCPFLEGGCISNNSIPGTSFICNSVYGTVNPGNPPTGPGCIPMGSLGITGVSSFAYDSTAPSNQTQNIYAWSDDVFYTKGKHAFKFGTLINHYQQTIEQRFTQIGSVSFTSVSNFFAGLANSYTVTDPLHNNDTRHWKYNTFGFYAQDDVRLTPRLTLNLGLRYEFNTVPTEVHGVSVADLHIATDTSNSAVPGPPFRNATLHNFSPRLGFAWDVFGNGKTSLHGGFAEVFDIANVGSALVQNALGQAPLDQQATNAAPSASSQLLVTLPLVVSSTSPPSLRIINYYIGQPHMLQYNLGLEHQLPGNLALTVAYAGSRGMKLWQDIDANPKAPEPGSTTSWPISTTINGATVTNTLFTTLHQNPSLSSVFFYNTGGDSYYDSLQVGLTKQLSHRLQFQSAYTYSKAIDDWQGQLGSDGQVSDPLNERLDRGPAIYDVTHNWRFNVIYGLPDFSQGRFLGKVVNGWSVSGIESLQSGYPFNPTMNTNTSGSGVSNSGGGIDRASWNPNFAGTLYPHTFGEWFNPAAFISPPNGTSPTGPVGTVGNVGRDVLRGPSLSNLDFAFRKDTAVRALGEAGSVQFRFETFNIFNHPNFALPASSAPYNGTSVASTAGQISSTVLGTDSRRVQLALKIIF